MAKIEKVLHTGCAHVTGGRDGHARSDDGRLYLQLSPPGTAGMGTNPEQLLAAGWSACFMGALKHAANARKFALPEAIGIESAVDLVHGGGGFFLRARFTVSLPGVDPLVAQALLDAAHQTCPYSKATRGNIQVSMQLAAAEPA